MTQAAAPAPKPLPYAFRHVGALASVVGLIALAVWALAWVFVLLRGASHVQFAADLYKAWLFAWLYFLGIPLGGMAILMLHSLTGGQWGYFIRRFAEAAMGTLPLLFLLFLPLLAGLRYIYPWAEAGAHDATVIHAHSYLNRSFFALRYVGLFAIWMLLAWRLRVWSMRADRGNVYAADKAYSLSAVGLVIYFVTMSLGAIDWIMSMEPGWYSTVFGFIIILAQGIAAMSVMVLLTALLARETPFRLYLLPRHFNDLATLLITIVILWAYNAFAQLLIVWMGNIQGEIPWYVKRSQGVWRLLSQVLVIVGFLAPFVLLLQRAVKKRGQTLLWIAVGLLAVRAIELYWVVAPSGREPYPSLHLWNLAMSIAAWIGIGGVWTSLFIWLLDRAPLMPLAPPLPKINETTGLSEAPHTRTMSDDVPPAAQPGIA